MTLTHRCTRTDRTLPICGMVRVGRWRNSMRGIATCDRAFESNPNAALALADLAGREALAGLSADAIGRCRACPAPEPARSAPSVSTLAHGVATFLAGRLRRGRAMGDEVAIAIAANAADPLSDLRSPAYARAGLGTKPAKRRAALKQLDPRLVASLFQRRASGTSARPDDMRTSSSRACDLRACPNDRAAPPCRDPGSRCGRLLEAHRQRRGGNAGSARSTADGDHRAPDRQARWTAVQVSG